jgi:iron complex outermembrane receptor protein
VGDAFVLYTVSPLLQVRLTASNFAPRDYLTGSRYESAASRVSAVTDATSYINWQLRFEMKL